MAARRDERVHELVAVRERPLHLHPVGREGLEQLQRARRRVEADRHADLRVLRREAREQHGDAALGGRQRAEPGRAHGEPRNPRAALEVGRVVRHGDADARTLRVALLERDHATEQAPVELRDRDLRRRVERRETGVGLLPGRARGGRAHGLDDGHAEVAERRCVPLLPGLADAVAALGDHRVAGARAAGGEHRDDQRVDVPGEQLERRDAPVGIAAQRVAPDRDGVAARFLDRAAERIHERRVAREAVRAVEADADRGPGRVVSPERLRERDVAVAGDVDAEIGHLARGREAVALEQERVGEEAQQLLDVVDVAVAEVLAGLRDGADRRQRERRHLGVGLGLAAEREQRDAALGAARAQQIEALGPAAPAAEHAAEHDARVRQHVLDERRVVDRCARVRAAHLGEAVRETLHGSGGREDLGIGGGYEAQHGSTSASQVTVSIRTPPRDRASRHSRVRGGRVPGSRQHVCRSQWRDRPGFTPGSPHRHAERPTVSASRHAVGAAGPKPGGAACGEC